MDKLTIGQENVVVISLHTEELIKTGVSHFTLQTFRSAFYNGE